MQEEFRAAIADIARGERKLGHHLGWVFLHTPASTLSRKTRLFLVALNPAHKTYCAPQKSDEKGNAYQVRTWRRDRKSPLQKQVCAFYKMIAKKLDRNWQSLMNTSLAGNFCPYASPSWAALSAKRLSIEFSISLWSRVIQFCAPSVVVCLGEISYQCMRKVVGSCGYEDIGKARLYRTGWRHRFGEINYILAEMNGPNRLLLVRLPHLSRYQVFERAGADGHFRPLILKVAKYLA
jgi:hypothetical protein